MPDLVEFDDLGLLDGGDLRSVLAEVPAPAAVAALAGAAPGLRRQLLMKLPAALAARLEADLRSRGPVTLDEARSAQRALVEALCRLSRGGHIAFDAPEDMVA